ncbi:MAG: tyrosine-type recombinase/integrase [Candidatus Bathyarchaeia archaeon]
MADLAPKCPECGSTRLYKDGFRYLADATPIQRYLCRSCGYRFSDPAKRQILKTRLGHNITCQVCGEESSPKNLASRKAVTVLAEVNGKTTSGQAGATEQTAQQKGKIIEYLWHLQKQGRKPYTILARRKTLMRLLKHGANLLDPENVKEVIAKENVSINTKVHYVSCYDGFAKWIGVHWTPPNYKTERKLPFIPTEQELDQLIAGCKKKLAAFLQTLKETMARAGEVWQLKWTDLNGNILTINSPEKGGLPRQFKISDKLVSMLNSLPKKHERIFGPNKSLQNFRINFAKRRRYIAQKLANPRLNKITFHTFRHWGATMLYHKTKDILYVKQQLGHKCIENTMVYTQLVNFESDEYHVAHAKTIAEEDKLIQAGFEFVRYDEREQVAIYRKRK